MDLKLSIFNIEIISLYKIIQNYPKNNKTTKKPIGNNLNHSFNYKFQISIIITINKNNIAIAPT
jgi:hypothetical protein